MVLPANVPPIVFATAARLPAVPKELLVAPEPVPSVELPDDVSVVKAPVDGFDEPIEEFVMVTPDMVPPVKPMFDPETAREPNPTEPLLNVVAPFIAFVPPETPKVLAALVPVPKLFVAVAPVPKLLVRLDPVPMLDALLDVSDVNLPLAVVVLPIVVPSIDPPVIVKFDPLTLLAPNVVEPLVTVMPPLLVSKPSDVIVLPPVV